MIPHVLHRLCTLGFLVLASSATLGAQASTHASPLASFDRIESRSYFFEEAESEMEYEVFVPMSYQDSTPTPLLVALHGMDSTPAQMIRYLGLTQIAEERGYIVVAPMGYNTRGWYGSRGPGRPSTEGEALGEPKNLGELSEMDVMNVLALTLEEFNIDRDRIYLMGHSMGGGGVWHLGVTYPDLWAGLAPVAPATWSSPELLEAIPHVPVIVVQGEADPLVPVEIARSWVGKMKELGMSYEYIEVPDGDHTAIIARDPDNLRRIFDFFDRHALD